MKLKDIILEVELQGGRLVPIDPTTNQVEIDGSVSFTVRPDLINETVSYGVSLPKKAAHSPRDLRLGSGLDAQFNIISKWPDGSVKTVLVTLTPESLDQTLEFGQDIANPQAPTLVKITESTVEVMGFCSFDLSKVGHYSTPDYTHELDSIVVLQGRSPGSHKATPRLLRNGHLMTELEVTYKKEDTPTCIFIYRIYPHGGKVDVSFTIEDRVEQESNNSFDFTTQNVEFALQEVSVRLDCTQQGPPVIGTQEGLEDLMNEDQIIQRGKRTMTANGMFSENPDAIKDDASGQYEYYELGDRAYGYAMSGKIALLCHNFWQEWPKRLYASENSIVYGAFHGEEDTNLYFSVENRFFKKPNALYHQRRGVAKTYRYRILNTYFFNDPTGSVTEFLREKKASYDDQAPLFHQENHAHLDSALASAQTADYDHGLMENMVLWSKEAYPARSEPTGWRDYGDHQRGGWDTTVPCKIPGFYNGAHIGAINYGIQYFRTKDVTWWKELVKETQHFIDIDVSHSAIHGRVKAPEYTPMPPGMVKSANHKEIDHDARNLHDGHMHMSGLMHYCMMTGDSRAIRVAQKIAQYWKHMAPYTWPLPRPEKYGYAAGTRRFTEAEREHGWPLDAMNQYVMMTGDTDYHKRVSSRVVRFLIGWWRTPSAHILSDKVIQEQGSYWFLDNMDNGISGTHSNGCQPWMAASIFTAVLQWYEIELETETVDRALAEIAIQMLVECMNHVIEYGMDGDNFVYSEARRLADPNGARLLISPLCRLYLLARNHYDIVHWRRIIKHHGQQLLEDIKPRQSGGRYGYEFYYPGWFFKDYPKVLASVNHIKLAVGSDELPPRSFLFRQNIHFEKGTILAYTPVTDTGYLVRVNEMGVVTVDTKEVGEHTFQYTLTGAVEFASPTNSVTYVYKGSIVDTQ